MSKLLMAVPRLRFPEFQDDWHTDRVDYFVKRYSKPVDVESTASYREIGVRSHGRGIFHKPEITGVELGNKRVFWVHPRAFVVNIVFGWEQAVALTSRNEDGFIASHRFPMFVPKSDKIDLDFMLLFFLRKRGKHLLELASPGGAGRNKTLGQNSFAELKITVPKLREQRKIAAFLGTVDEKLAALRRQRELLAEYKRGVMQRLFSQQIRFTQDDGTPFPDWERKKLRQLASFRKGKGISKQDIVENGQHPCIRYGELYTDYSEVIDRIQSYTNADPAGMVLSKANDVIIPASGEDRLDMAHASCIQAPNVILGGDLNIIRGKFNGIFLAYYLNVAKRFDIARVAQGNSVVHLYSNQLAELIIDLPCSKEQRRISSFLTTIDKKIVALEHQIEQVSTFKKGLLQQMFV